MRLRAGQRLILRLWHALCPVLKPVAETLQDRQFGYLEKRHGCCYFSDVASVLHSPSVASPAVAVASPVVVSSAVSLLASDLPDSDSDGDDTPNGTTSSEETVRNAQQALAHANRLLALSSSVSLVATASSISSISATAVSKSAGKHSYMATWYAQSYANIQQERTLVDFAFGREGERLARGRLCPTRGTASVRGSAPAE